MCQYAAVFALVGFIAGQIYGRHMLIRSLLIGADNDGRTAQKLFGKFYYLVPEKEYVSYAYLRQKGSDVVDDN
jgi:hypothetical protein